MKTKNYLPFTTILVAFIAAPLSINCSSSTNLETTRGTSTALSSAASPGTELQECRDDDGNLFALMPADPTLTPAQFRGRCTWVNYTGGTENLFRKVAIKTKGAIDAIHLVDSRDRDTRWERLGSLTEPDCKAPTGPDQYGLWFDECQDPKATGIMGFRKLENPKFDASKWSVDAYRKDASSVEPPYLIGSACGSCHVALNPTKPAADPGFPQWENLIYAFGNQFLNEPGYFGGAYVKEQFEFHALATQERGTSDTSRQASDHINNPNVINSIINLADRPYEMEQMNDGSFQAVHHILKDGSDSIGVAGASLRVFVNEGMCMEEWVKHHDLIDGNTQQTPVRREVLFSQCEAYRKTAARMTDMADFLETQHPLYLKDAPNGRSFLTSDNDVLTKGKVVFADNCATCHSSKQPPGNLVDPSSRKEWFRQSVLSTDFLEHNFLSDDKRYSVVELKTNAARALGTNPLEGHIWEEYSSKTFKSLSSPGTLSLVNPYDAKNPIEFQVPGGGRGWYRTPSIAAIWATAPFLHNNALGKYTADPSVAGRVDAFNDAATKLLWPEQRLNSIKRTSVDSVLKLPLGEIHVPAGTPVNLLANVDPRPLTNKVGIEALGLFDNTSISVANPVVASALLKFFSQCPDLVEDEGHYYGAQLDSDDKRALIEYLKTL